MKTYDDKDIKDIQWTKFKIVVPTEDDKLELMDAFQHIHYSDVDSNFVPVNQLIHQYLEPNNIIVNLELYNTLNND